MNGYIRTKESAKNPLVGVIEEDINGVSFIVFDITNIKILASHRENIKTLSSSPELSEQNPVEILNAIDKCLNIVTRELKQQGNKIEDIITIGVVSQRETAVCWNKRTGKCLYNCITYQDTRTIPLVEKFNNLDFDLKSKTGANLTYSSDILKLRWLIDNVSDVKNAILAGNCVFGSVNSWIIWNLTGALVTDVTNASKTMLMNINTCKWDSNLLNFFDVPENVLPEIRSNSELYGFIQKGPLKDTPITASLRDRQATFVGLQCMKKGSVYASFDSEIAVLCNIGTDIIHSNHGANTIVAYQMGPKEKPVYALENHVGIFEEAIKWLKENMHAVDDYEDIEREIKLAEKEPQGDVVLVPAFDGLPAPYHQPDARGTICGITFETSMEHFIKAAVEAICFQTADILDLMRKEVKTPIDVLKVEGNLTGLETLMQYESDITGLKLERVILKEVASLGVATMAAYALDYRNNKYSNRNRIDRKWIPQLSENDRKQKIKKWHLALEKSLGWM